MGPSPSSSSLPFAPPSSSSSAIPPSLADWFFSDRDSQILTQALTHELSTPSVCQSLNTPPESRFLRPDCVYALQALEPQNEIRQQGDAATTGSAATTESAMKPFGLYREDGLRENVSLQVASPPSHSSLSTSNPGSPYSSVSTITTTNNSVSVPADPLFSHTNSNNGPGLAFAFNSVNDPSMPAADGLHPSSSSLQLSTAAAVSAQAIRGKPCKRRSRASNRSPIMIFSADVSNFRAMVQRLTGIPSTSSAQLHTTSSLMNSEHVKNPYANSASLPTLDTSAALLRCKPPMKDPLEGFSLTRNNHNEVPGYLLRLGEEGRVGSVMNAPPMSGCNSLHSQQFMLGDQCRLLPSSPTLSSIWNNEDDAKLEANSSFAMEAPQYTAKQAMTPPLDELAAMKAHYNALDSWLFFDGVLANQTPQLEIARMA